MKKNLLILLLGGLIATLFAHAATRPAVVTAQGTLSVNETGPAGQTYQWKINGVDIPGANGPTLPIANVYTLVITTGAESVEVGDFDYSTVYTR